MFGNDINSTPNDVGADSTGVSDVFANDVSAAGGATAAIISAINAPQIAAQNKTISQNNNTNLLIFAGVAILLVFVFMKS